MKNLFWKESLMVIFPCLLIAQNVIPKTCSEVYEGKSQVCYVKSALGGTLEVIVAPIFLPSINIYFDEIAKYRRNGTCLWTDPQKRKKVAELLRAASILKDVNANQYEAVWANRAVDHFFKKYISARFPETPRVQVIDNLAWLDASGVEEKVCHGLLSAQMLAEKFFPNGKFTPHRLINRIHYLK